MAKKRKQTKQNQKILTSIIITIIIILIGYYLYYTYSNIEITPQNYETQRTLSTGNEQNVEKAEEKSRTIADTLEKTMESVVGISKLKDNGNSIFSSNTESTLGLGTGVIISENGYILSNEHVTGEKYSTCYITLENSKKYEGTVVWSDTDLDLSITKIEATNLKYISLGDSDKIRIGETVYAIGNPIGFEFRRTVTSGIVSAKNRTIKFENGDNVSYMSGLIQTDATINPGNSGGPLITPDGNVVGINTVKISSAEGIGFAVPIDTIKTVIEKFKLNDKFDEAKIGIYAYDKEVIPYLSYNNNFDKGIYVVQITPNGPASKTELKIGDIINSIDGVELSSMNGLKQYIYTKNIGDEVKLNITRGKIKKDIILQLGS